jgi:uncharacterized OB-fold protein
MKSVSAPPVHPLADNLTRFFWEGAREGKLLAQQCADCGHRQHPPSPVCRSCLSDRVSPTELSGRGTVYTYTVTTHVFHPSFAEKVPYILVVVELEEQPGLKMLSRMTDCTEDDVRVDMEVEVRFTNEGEGVVLPLFAPVALRGATR